MAHEVPNHSPLGYGVPGLHLARIPDSSWHQPGGFGYPGHLGQVPALRPGYGNSDGGPDCPTRAEGAKLMVGSAHLSYLPAHWPWCLEGISSRTPEMSAEVKTATTPGRLRAAETSTDFTRAWA